MKSRLGLLFAITSGLFAPVFAAGETRFLQQPDISTDHLVFVYAGDLWIADRAGTNPRRLTSDPAQESEPHFSPDGRWIAYTADYHGNSDVYLISVEGGRPRRLTYHPGADIARIFTGRPSFVPLFPGHESAAR